MSTVVQRAVVDGVGDGLRRPARSARSARRSRVAARCGLVGRRRQASPPGASTPAPHVRDHRPRPRARPRALVERRSPICVAEREQRGVVRAAGTTRCAAVERARRARRRDLVGERSCVVAAADVGLRLGVHLELNASSCAGQRSRAIQLRARRATRRSRGRPEAAFAGAERRLQRPPSSVDARERVARRNASSPRPDTRASSASAARFARCSTASRAACVLARTPSSRRPARVTGPRAASSQQRRTLAASFGLRQPTGSPCRPVEDATSISGPSAGSTSCPSRRRSGSSASGASRSARGSIGNSSSDRQRARGLRRRRVRSRSRRTTSASAGASSRLLAEPPPRPPPPQPCARTASDGDRGQSARLHHPRSLLVGRAPAHQRWPTSSCSGVPSRTAQTPSVIGSSIAEPAREVAEHRRRRQPLDHLADLGRAPRRRVAPRAISSPARRLRPAGCQHVTIRSPMPGEPGERLRPRAAASPSRAISASPRVISAAFALSPRPRPSTPPAASAITFFAAAQSSTPTRSSFT